MWLRGQENEVAFRTTRCGESGQRFLLALGNDPGGSLTSGAGASEFPSRARKNMAGTPAPHGLENDCKHVAPSDGEFKGRLRFHQSWYRHHALGLSPGPNPQAGGELYGSMLTDSDGQRGFNFLTDEIYGFAAQRLSEGEGAIEPDRLRRNLLSSQPMCFNLFGPLHADLHLATRLISTLPGVPRGLKVRDVQVEYDGEGLLGDRTAFDAFVEYELENGDLGFIAVETKLTEPFSQKEYPSKRYTDWFARDNGWWLPGSETDFPNPETNQLWRDHLLTFAVLRQSPGKYKEAFCAVVYHDLDEGCPAAIKAYRRKLTEAGQATLLEWPLGKILSSWHPSADTRQQSDWLSALRLRYVDVNASELAWSKYREKQR